MSAADSALSFGLLSACNGFGMVAAGYASDRYNRLACLVAIFGGSRDGLLHSHSHTTLLPQCCWGTAAQRHAAGRKAELTHGATHCAQSGAKHAACSLLVTAKLRGIKASALICLCRCRLTVCCDAVVRGLSYLLLGFVRGKGLLLVFAVLFGFVDYSVVPFVVSLVPPACTPSTATRLPASPPLRRRDVQVGSYCGSDVIGLGVGILLAWHSLGAAIGSWMGGHVYDSSGSYDTALVVCGSLCGLAAAAVVIGGCSTGEPWVRSAPQAKGAEEAAAEEEVPAEMEAEPASA